MRASFQVSLAAVLGIVLGCTHASPEAEPATAVAPPEPAPALAPAPDLTSTPATAAPTAVPAIPPPVLEAKQTLLRFADHDHAKLEQARAIVDAFEAPTRFEERGELDGDPYYYARDAYEALGITVHRDAERITNVELTPRAD